MWLPYSLLSPLFSIPLQVYHNGKYGSVCDDGWDIKDANVVCRMLGMGNATAATVRAKYGQAVGDVWMDDVNCTGRYKLNSYFYKIIEPLRALSLVDRCV